MKFGLRRGANESAFGPSPTALTAASKFPVSHYGDPQSSELREFLAEKHGVSREEILVGGGIDELLSLFCRLLLDPGDSVTTTLGSYATFEHGALATGAILNLVPYRNDQPDLDELATCDSKLVYLANPDNPSGAFFSAERIRQLRNHLPERIPLLLDEAYIDFAPPDLVVENLPGIIRLRTYSKAHGLAGMRIGYALAAAEMVRELDKIRLHFAVNGPAQAAALASERDPGHLAKVVVQTKEGRERLSQMGYRLNLPALPSFGNFVLLDLGSADRANRLLADLLQRGVFVRKPSQPPLDRCIRVTVGPEDEDLILESVLKASLTAIDSKSA